MNHYLGATGLFMVSVLVAALAVTGWQQPLQWHAPGWLAIGTMPVALQCDKLSALFLALLACVTACCAVYSPRYLQHLGSRINSGLYWCSLFFFFSAMTVVILAASASAFIVAWEVMALSSTVLVVSEYRRREAQFAAFVYVVATRLSTLFLSAGFLLMFYRFNDWSFASWSFAEPSTWLAAGLCLVGLCMKAGVWPFHIWLPYAHPEAPGPVSALMSAVMVKIALYALLRFFLFGNLSCQPIIFVLFAVSIVSAFWGILFAVNQRDLKRILAYSTVENIGLILASISLCLWCRAVGLQTIAELALLAAVLHIVAHSICKALLFLCAASVDFSAHTRDLNLLGGLNKVMPLTGALFVLGSSAICALPPLNCFASKWCLYQALVRSAFSMSTMHERAICLLGIGCLCCVGALSVVCFAKAVGVVFCGQPRAHAAANAREVPLSMKLPVIILAVLCVSMGITCSLTDFPFSEVVALCVGSNVMETKQSVLPLWQLCSALLLLLLMIYGLLYRSEPAKASTWDCGFGESSIRSQVTADSVSQPIARIFSPLLQHKIVIDISGSDRKHFPEKIIVEPQMVSLLETRLYRPFASVLNKLSGLLAKLQAGSIHLYLSYVCLTLILVVIVGAYLE